MKLGLRITAFLATSCALAIACSDSAPAPFDPPSADSGAADAAAHLPPASEAGPIEDAAPDAAPPVDEAVTCDVAPCPVEIVAGQTRFCVLMSDQTVRCWGDDTQGALGRDPGDGGDAGAIAPVSPVQGLTQVTQLSAAGTTTCARSATGAVTCWGGNDSGQLALSTSDYDRHAKPTAVTLTGSAARVDVGPRGACATLTSGDVMCWGANDQGQLARPLSVQIGGPTKIASQTGKIVQTAVSTNTYFAVDDTGKIASWGATTGAVGAVAGRVSSVSPDPLPGVLSLDSISSLAVSPWRDDFSPIDFSELGIAHACAIAHGKVYCWGQSSLGAMGFGVPFAFVTPTEALLRDGANPIRVAVSTENTCLQMTDGTLQCAGDDSRGQLGRGADAGLFSDVFTKATAFTDHALRLAVSDNSTCVIVRGGKVMCWGGNSNGELARGTTDDDPHVTPAVVKF